MDLKEKIVIKGASEHNLKNINLELPRNKLIVFTGVSGSGKSSLAFDTLYAEGQRRYVESLSAYARQFLGQMEKPKVDYISGLSPAISIEQKSASKNPRSTVGTLTEIYDYLRILFARIGKQYCYQCGREVGAQTVQQMVDKIMQLPYGTKIIVLAPIVLGRKGEHKEIFDKARQDGFVRVRINKQIVDLSEEIVLDKKRKHDIEIVVDRLILREGIIDRLTDSVETALKVSEGTLLILYQSDANGSQAPSDGEVLKTADTFDKELLFSEKRACTYCNISFGELTPQLFSFNSPQGMCPNCDGLGSKFQVDPDLIVPDKNLSIREGAIVPWGDLSVRDNWNSRIVKAVARHFKIDLDIPFKDLPEEHKNIILYGKEDERIHFEFKGENISAEFFKPTRGVVNEILRLYHQTKSEGARLYYEKFFSKKPCEACQGTKLRPEARSVKVGGKTIVDIVNMSVREALNFFENIKLSKQDTLIAEELIKEIKNRLGFMVNVGLHYLTLDRSAPSLSGGEAQRIRLASQIGSGLVGVLYILDEPSIGLHQRDNHKLLDTLLSLRDLGNTVIVVEHDENTIRTADFVVDFGPGAGTKGGEIVYAGDVNGLLQEKKSLTGRYLKGELSITTPKRRREVGDRWLKIIGASQNNLKNIDVSIPVGVFTCITGVSGSGKSSLINQTLLPALTGILTRRKVEAGKYKEIDGVDYFDEVIDINQKPIGRTPRSNPATYTKLFDHIRNLFALLPQSKVRGYKPGRFSFNVPGGRCEACQGDGIIKIEMHFLPDVYVTCEECKGKRFNRDTLAIRFKGKNIADVLNMDVQEAYEFFHAFSNIRRILETLRDVGLDYIKLGQPATTLSGGEAQRVKLARELCKKSYGRTLYILDEPTTGLHFDDIKKLLNVLNRLVDAGNTVVVIEHNLDVIKTADYIIDLGPEGGDEGGEVIAVGTPEEVAANPISYTGKFLKDKLLSNLDHPVTIKLATTSKAMNS